MKQEKQVVIYCDGACSGNPGPGGWGAVLIYGGHSKEIYGSEAHTTNNRMELMAAIKALETLSRSCKVAVYTDSKYVKHGITEWIHGWKKNGWRNSAKKPVINTDLWKELDQLAVKHEISWHWVKGHGDDEFNILADKLACEGRDEALRGKISKGH